MNINLTDKNNGQWKGNKVGYGAIHDYIKRRFPRPTHCSKCIKIGKVDLANVSGKYKRDLSDWKWLCRSCHMRSDGRGQPDVFQDRKRCNLCKIIKNHSEFYFDKTYGSFQPRCKKCVLLKAHRRCLEKKYI
jgi:hypothetical protein